ncbi:182 kDa tankyrase-1-binding protein [Vulpes lagopus]
MKSGHSPAWGANVGTRPRPFGPGAPCASQRRQTQTYTCSRTLRSHRASRVPSSDEEVVEEPQNHSARMSLGTKGLKVNLFPGLSLSP